MKIRTHHYELHPGPDPTRAAAGPRCGALLKIVFEDGTTGFADLHPWTEFGHAPLADHLASLTTDQPTSLAKLAVRHARTDAAARRAGVSLFTGLPEVRSHALFTDWISAPREIFQQCAAAGYTAAKLKIGRHPNAEIEKLNQLADFPLRWRLDANSSFDPASLDAWLRRLSPKIRHNIEFLEDPCPYDPQRWSEISQRDNTSLALDWQLPASPPPWPGAGIIVIKPAAQEAFTLAMDAAHAGMEIVVTHSMDHPFGQSVALWTAMRLRQRHGELVRDGGLQAAGLYRPDSFSPEYNAGGPSLLIPTGNGFGFDELLEAVDWRPLVS